MKRRWFIALLGLLGTAATLLAGNNVPPFSEVDKETPDPEVTRLVAIQANWRKDLDAASQAEKRIMAMGTNAVPALIILLKRAANNDPRVLHPEQVQDYGDEIRKPLYDLRDIGDRRAIPVLSALVKYDHPKPKRILQALAEMLCHGSDEQILLDSKADDPNLARAAQMVIRDPMTFEPSKRNFRKKQEN